MSSIGFRLFFLLAFLLSPLHPAWAQLCGNGQLDPGEACDPLTEEPLHAKILCDSNCQWLTTSKLPPVFSCYPQMSLNRKSGQFCLEECGSGSLLCAQSVETTDNYDAFLLEFAPTSTNLWKLEYRFWHADQSITDFQITQVDGLIKKVTVTSDGLDYRLFHQDSPTRGLKLACTQPELCEVCWTCIEAGHGGALPFCGDGIREFGEYCDGESDCPGNCRRAPPYLCEPPPTPPTYLPPRREICPDRTLPWTKTYETPAGFVLGDDIEVDENGTLYVLVEGLGLGIKMGQMDACGEPVWASPVFASISVNITPQLDIDECGNSYFTRHTQDALGNYTLHISKISFDGDPLGLTSFHPSASDWEGDRIWDIAVDKVNDALYVVGERGPQAASDIWVRKYNKNLEFIWERIHPSGGSGALDLNDAAFAVTVDTPEGDVYITGRLVYPEGSLDTPGEYLFTAKYNPDGTLLWSSDWTTITDPTFPNLADRDYSRGVDIEVEKETVYVVVRQEPADGFPGSWAPKILTQFNRENGDYLGTTIFWTPQQLQTTGIDLWEAESHIYLSGYFTEIRPWDAWGAKFNSSVTLLWEDPIRTLLPVAYDVYLNVSVDPTNDYSHFIGWVAPVAEDGVTPTDMHVIVRKITPAGTIDDWSGF